MRSVPLAFVLWLAACSEPVADATDTSGAQTMASTEGGGETSSSAGSFGSDTSTSTSSAESTSAVDSTDSSDGADSSSTEAPTDALVDRGVVVRYYLDEADGGQSPVAALDAIADPVDLQLEYFVDPEQPVYAGPDGMRGLAWSQALNVGSARALAGAKVSEALHGATTATIELVMTIDSVGPVVAGGSRLLSLGPGYFGPLALGGDIDQGLRLSWDQTPIVRWNADDLFAGERVVVHVVVDTARADAAERARLYVDGELRPPTPGFELGLDMPIEVAPDDELVLGNAVAPYAGGERPSLGNSPAGRISYAAIYAVALDEDEIGQNLAILALDDDTP